MSPPLTEYEALSAQLKQQPHDPNAWKRLISLAEESGNLDKIRASFDALLQQYPNTSSAQIRYIGHFLQDPLYCDETEDLFKKFLVKSPEVDLWKLYLTYVRRVNATPSTRDAVHKSYEFAVKHIGHDKDSGDIWRDYIQFLRSGETTTTWEEQQKMDALRKVYHRAVQIPLECVETLWQELESFENNLNRITAKKFMSDLTSGYIQARTTFRQIIKITNHMGMTILSSPRVPSTRTELVLPALPTFNVSERMLVGKWKSYLKWEETDPLMLEEKDKSVLVSRIQSIYRKALIRMRYYPEIWFMAYTWLNSVGKHDEAIMILKAGIEANPASYLLAFAYAEAFEVKEAFAEVHSQYDRLLGVLRAKLEELEARIKTEAYQDASNSSTSADLGDLNSQSQSSPLSKQPSDEKRHKPSELRERRTEYGLAYNMYMRFGRRAEGTKSSRAIFGRARQDRWTPWEVYEAAALMEYHCSQDGAWVGSRIFEKGLQRFADDVEFVLRYLSFLISINDKINAHALFERVISTFVPDRARPLWELWARYQYQYGDLNTSLQLEKRIAEVYPLDPPIKRFAQRHTHLGTDAIAAQDLGFTLARKASKTGAQTLENAIIAPSNSGSRGNGGGSGSNNNIASHKRAVSPDYRERGGGVSEDYPQSHKRTRGMSPPPPRIKRDRNRWDPPPSSRRRHSPPPPSWEREGRDGAPLPPPREKEKPKVASLPNVISWFIGELPTPSSFDGPVFETEDLMNLFRNAVIPSSGRSKSPPLPTPPRTGSRLSPDYGPYQGPGGGRVGRRH
ncbi:hypothetical protein C0989_000732 [Termitomyces sp. Mn162]|nr:hypothetical protein C0989_000732 [Termitomyces sp. Mn162]